MILGVRAWSVKISASVSRINIHFLYYWSMQIS